MSDPELPGTALLPAFAGTHEPKPLPFDPARLTGLSERLIRSHWENNCCGAVVNYRFEEAVSRGGEGAG